MTVIKLATNDQDLVFLEKPVIATGDVNSVELQVEFDQHWDSYAGREAVFYTLKKPEPIPIVLVDNKCLVPFERLVDVCTLHIGIRGVSDEKVKTSTLAKIKLVEGAPNGTEEAEEPTADVYQQLLTANGVLNSRINELMAQKSDGTLDVTELAVVKADSMYTCEGIKVYSNGINALIDINRLAWKASSSGWWTLANVPEELAPFENYEKGRGDKLMLPCDDVNSGAIFALSDSRLQICITDVAKAQSAGNISCQLPYALKNPVIDELADVRVGYDGTSYPTAGDAVRGQIEKVLSETYETDQLLMGQILENGMKTDALKDDVEKIDSETHYIAYEQVSDGSKSFPLVVGEDVNVGDSVILTRKGDVSIIYTRKDGALGNVYPPADSTVTTFELKIDENVIVYNIQGCEVSIPQKKHVADLKKEVDAKLKPYVIDSEHYTYGDDALQAILDGRHILIKVPNKSEETIYSNFMPVLQYQLPNENNDYLTLFYLKDGIAQNLMVALVTQSFDGVFGEITMKLSKAYAECPLEG